MKNKTKNTLRKRITLSLVAITLITCALFSMPTSIYANDTTPEKEQPSVAITKANFPNKNFRKYLKKTFDYDKDGSVFLCQVMEINCSFLDITSLEGIEHFTELTSLTCHDTGLLSIDVSKNKKLKVLHCSQNPLASIDVSKNKALVSLDVMDCGLRELDVTQNPKLEVLDCGYNQFTSLNLKKNPKLKKLECYDNQLEKLNLNYNPLLEEVECEFNQLAKLKVNKCHKLVVLDCFYNKLEAITVSKKAKKLVIQYDTDTKLIKK